MARHPFLLVDAFTDRPLAGNACAVVLDAEPLDAATMQAVAREMNQSETAFVLPSRVADHRARYFTPGGEIPMAGHPTVATLHALVHTGRVVPEGDVTHLSLELQVGPLPIALRRADGGLQVVMGQKAPVFGGPLAPGDVLPAFGLAADDVLAGAPVQVVSTGTPQLLVPLRDADALARARVHAERLRALQDREGFFSAHLFCLGGYTDAGHTRARHFGIQPDPWEDPFTGSATGSMGAWLWHHGHIDTPRFVAEQGHGMGRPGSAEVEVVGPPDAIETVRVGGRAVVTVEGELLL